jgi:hypothetical protein
MRRRKPLRRRLKAAPLYRRNDSARDPRDISAWGKGCSRGLRGGSFVEIVGIVRIMPLTGSPVNKPCPPPALDLNANLANL